jgi:hypothetical protein
MTGIFSMCYFTIVKKSKLKNYKVFEKYLRYSFTEKTINAKIKDKEAQWDVSTYRLRLILPH